MYHRKSAPHSKRCGSIFVPGTIEALSTWHIPLGLMSELVEESKSKSADAGPQRKLFRWGVVDVLHRCPASRACESCELLPECEGRAKKARGHIYIDDAITMKRRSSNESWQAEMLCLRPSRRDAVYPEFDAERHVVDRSPEPSPKDGSFWIGGMDFGFRSPAVVLWAHLDLAGVITVCHEHTRDQLTLEKHIRVMQSAEYPILRWIGVDPAGAQRSDQTGLSPISLLRNAGFTIRNQKTPVEFGIRAIRQRLDPAVGEPTLFIHPRCVELIRALTSYRFPSDNPYATLPVKDGADHAADALRYMVVNVGASKTAKVTTYW